MPKIIAISLTGIGFSLSAEIDCCLIISAKRGSNFSSMILSIKGRNATSSSSGFSNDITDFTYNMSIVMPIKQSIILKNNRKWQNE